MVLLRLASRAEKTVQKARVQRLVKELIAACFDGALTVAFAHAAGDDQDARMLNPMLLPQLATQNRPVHIGQSQVQDHHVGPKPPRRIESGVRGEGIFSAMAHVFQQHGEHLHVVQVVVNH